MRKKQYFAMHQNWQAYGKSINSKRNIRTQFFKEKTHTSEQITNKKKSYDDLGDKFL
jgi:hypothetical protein